ncbi:hypothetical protein DAEQUDRAFT_57066 [Daedalea quercina L-15889]|uniref:Uncharacterized protein n=1 Tax=Daedalea quercina L-15889 TaxID=1314783 RepID=A0A165SJU3_9APHY|nr:hypothetical protein DAEQUDRAFT_57066 [Daedalea quercina L-15889]
MPLGPVTCVHRRNGARFRTVDFGGDRLYSLPSTKFARLASMQASSQQAQLTQPSLASFLLNVYPFVKARHPGEGRRKWRLRVAEEFWKLPAEQKASYAKRTPVSNAIAEAEFVLDDDPLDELSDDAPSIGILLRTDYSNEEAWRAFCGKLQEGEAEFASAQSPEDVPMSGGTPQPAGGSTPSSVPDNDPNATEEDDENEDEDEDSAHIFFVIDAPPEGRARFENISNLAVLRMFNDVDIRAAPSPPAGTKRIKPPNRLVDHDGWQEIYTGKTVWIYDAKSNVDQCVRLVSGHGGPYGTASGDSWRARVSHICELQVNLTSGAMTIDFGGMDRWDYEERVRNLEEAVRLLS